MRACIRIRRRLWLRTAAVWLTLAATPFGMTATVQSPRLAPATAAEVMAVPMDLQVPLILKILVYDRNFGEREQSAVNIGVVYVPGDPASLRARDELMRALDRVSDKTVKGLPIRYTSLEFTSDTDVEAAVLARRISVLYIAPGNGANLEQLRRLSERNQVMTVTGIPDYVNRGAAVGIGLRQDKPEILINLASARSAGGEFDASLLRIARVIR
jgi:hypothetical protein